MGILAIDVDTVAVFVFVVDAPARFVHAIFRIACFRDWLIVIEPANVAISTPSLFFKHFTLHSRVSSVLLSLS